MPKQFFVHLFHVIIQFYLLFKYEVLRVNRVVISLYSGNVDFCTGLKLVKEKEQIQMAITRNY